MKIPPPQQGEELLQCSKGADLSAERPPEQKGCQHRRDEKNVTAPGDPLDRSTMVISVLADLDSPEGAQGVDPYGRVPLETDTFDRSP